MDKLTGSQTAILEVLDDQIARLEKKIEKVQPYINELNKLRATRRVLLSEKGNTSGGGNAERAKLTQEEVISFMRNAESPVKPQDISEAFQVSGTIVRSHLNRHKDTTYELTDDGWILIEGSDDLEEDE